MEDAMLIIRVWEGLGNQMFQYAYARAMKERGEHVRLDMGRYYDDMFSKTQGSCSRENGIHNFNIRISSIDVEQYGKYKYLRKKTLLDNVIFFLSKHSLWRYNFYETASAGYYEKAVCLHGNYYIKGYFQNERYFADIRDILLREFTPKRKIVISSRLRSVLSGSETVSVHIRRGDYVRLRNNLNLAYYEKALEQIRKFYQNPVFLIFSDDLVWVKENMQLPEENVFYVNEDGNYADYEELLIMSRCKSNIIANSTFSWWAAWLNQNDEKHVIAPKKWFRSQTGIVPDEWTTI